MLLQPEQNEGLVIGVQLFVYVNKQVGRHAVRQARMGIRRRVFIFLVLKGPGFSGPFVMGRC